MNCPLHEQLSAYIDGEMPHPERKRFQAHLAGCAACSNEAEKLDALRAGLAALPAPALGFDLAAQYAQLPAPRRTALRPRISRWQAWAGGGISVALSLGAGIWLGGLLLAAPAHVTPAFTVDHVFAPIPPGGLCAVPEICKSTRGVR